MKIRAELHRIQSGAGRLATTEVRGVAEGNQCAIGHGSPARFRFVRQGQQEPKCLRHAITHRPLVRTAAITALVVGTILTAINQGNVLVHGTLPAALAWKIPLTYCVPYCVATWSALRISKLS